MPASKSQSARKAANKKKAISVKERAGLIFPVSRVMKLLKRDRLNQRTGKGSAIVMTAILEYITGEILELAGNVAQEAGKKRIVPRHVSLALS